MKKLEYVQNLVKKQYDYYDFSIPYEKLQWSGEIIDAELNDGTIEPVDRMVEFTLCKINAAYFINRWGWTYPAKGGPIPLKLFDFQIEALESFQKNGKIIFRKSRQVGASVISGSYALWRANFYKGEMIKIISLTQNDAIEFKEKTIDLTYENIPAWFRSSSEADSRTRLRLVNKSQIQVLAKSKNAGRGGTPSLVIIDEAAFNEWMSDIWKSIEPSLDKGGDCIVISTTNGVGNWYHTTYTKAEAGENEFYPIFIPWWRYPNRSNPWREDILQGKIENKEEFIKKEEKKQLEYKGKPKQGPWLWKRWSNAESDREFRQEILAEFLGSGDTFIEYSKLVELDTRKRSPIIKNEYPNHSLCNGLWIWEQPRSDSMYILTADTATGHGKDYSTFHVIDVYKRKQVAEYKAQIATDTFGGIIKTTARFYNNAYVIIECNHPGPAVFNEVYKHQTDSYPNVYVKNKSGNPWGWDTTPRSRILLMEALNKDLKNNYTEIYSERLIEEIKTFIWKDNKPQAMKGCNDDLVIAYAIYCHLIEQVHSSRPAPIHTKDKVVDYENSEGFSEDWELKEEEFMERHNMTMEEWYWMQEKDLPKEYIEWKKQKRREKKEELSEELAKDNNRDTDNIPGLPVITR